MHSNILLFLVFGVFNVFNVFIGLVTAAPLSPVVGQGTPGEVGPVAGPGIVPTSSNPSTVTFNSLHITSIPTSATLISSTSSTFISTTSVTQHESNAFIGTPTPVITTSLIQPSSAATTLPLISNVPSDISIPQVPASSPSPNLSASSSFNQELPTSTLSPLSSTPSSSLTASPGISPTVRHILIAVFICVPTLTILGYFITLRLRRAHKLRGDLESNVHPDGTAVGAGGFKEKKTTRFSSFFGINHGDGFREMDENRDQRQMYATSIHSSSGLAGVGAHRAGRDNGVPPMITYIKLPENQVSEGTRKANFENPFGTPPPVEKGFVIAPSRVSPHIPQTPPLHLVKLPLPAIVNDPRVMQNVERTKMQSLNNAGEGSPDSESVDPHPIRPYQSEAGYEKMAAPEYAPSSPTTKTVRHEFLFPHPPAMIPAYKPPLPLRIRRGSTASRPPSVPSPYGGIASPHIPAPVAPTVTPVLPTPVLPYLVSSPSSDETSALPYLSSSPSNLHLEQDQPQTMGPIIVIEAATTVGSMSEYDDDGSVESGNEMKGLSCMTSEIGEAAVAHTPTRRDGVIGSPYGYVPPSTTFSTASSYSSSSISGSALSTTSSTSSHASSHSSGPVMSTSGSDGSSITVKASAVVPGKSHSADEAEASIPTSDSLWIPESFAELERGRR